MLHNRGKLLVVLVGVVVLGLLGSSSSIAGRGKGSAEASAKVYRMRFSHGLPPQHAWAKALTEFCALAEEKSNGRLKIDVYPAGQLFKAPEFSEAVRKGLVEMGNMFTAYAVADVPAMYGLAPAGTFWDVTTNLEVVRSWLNQEGPGALVAQAMEDKGFKILAWYSSGVVGDWIGLIGRGTPARTPDAIKGKKVRALGSFDEKLFRTMGARPVFISGADLYTGLQYGTIELLPASPAHVMDRSLHEVTDWYIPRLSLSSLQQFFVVTSVDYFNSLPEDLQEVLLEAGREVTKKITLNLDHPLNPFKTNEAYLAKMKALKDFSVEEPLTRDELMMWMKPIWLVTDKWLKDVSPEAVQIYNVVNDIQKKQGLPYHYIK